MTNGIIKIIKSSSHYISKGLIIINDMIRPSYLKSYVGIKRTWWERYVRGGKGIYSNLNSRVTIGNKLLSNWIQVPAGTH